MTVHCAICDQNMTGPIYGAGALYECPSCSHVNAAISQSAENQVFAHDSYLDWRRRENAALVEEARERSRYILSHVRLPPGAVLELGCSTGEFLDAMNRSGWQAYGLDLSEGAIEESRRRFPKVTVAVGISPSDLTGREPPVFDLVVGFHVVEHIPDIKALGRNLSEWGGGRGTVVFFVPNWASWSRRVFGMSWPSIIPEHVHQFTPQSIRTWLADAGFQVDRIDTYSSSWHWLGAIKRKLAKSSAGSDAPSVQKPRPGVLAMRALHFADALLTPFFWLENRFHGGAELRVVASPRQCRNVPAKDDHAHTA